MGRDHPMESSLAKRTGDPTSGFSLAAVVLNYFSGPPLASMGRGDKARRPRIRAGWLFPGSAPPRAAMAQHCGLDPVAHFKLVQNGRHVVLHGLFREVQLAPDFL